MKTQKQLPNEFTFICDEHSREQLKKLGVDIGEYEMYNIYQYYYVKSNKVIFCDGGKYTKYPLINLFDYIEQEQPEQKWQEKTRGGYEYHIYEKFEGFIFGRLKINDGDWKPLHWHDKGNYSFIEKHNWDLIPYNPLLTTLEKELEEVRSKEKEILEKIEGLKK